jgi:hypothetical protein
VTYGGSTAAYIVDRFYIGLFGTTYSNPALTIQQVSDAPSGFTNSLRVTSSATNTADANKLGSFYSQPIEGFNIADLGWGTANAQAVTVQFRVKASKIGTVSVSVENSARDRSYVTTVSISAANTWETKTVTIPGDTSGTWLTTNGVGLDFKIGIMSNGSWLAGTGGSWLAGRAILSTSQTNFIAVSGDYITITGVQLEAGSVATPFEQIDYGRELMLCQRYFQKTYNQSAVPGSTTSGIAGAIWSANPVTNSYPNLGTWNFAVPMRAAPNVIGYNPGTGASGGFRGDSTDFTPLAIAAIGERSASFFGSNVSVGTSVFVNVHATASAEL